MAIDLKQCPKGWLQSGEQWPGQKNGLPKPGTPESEEFHRQAWEKEKGQQRPSHLGPTLPTCPRLDEMTIRELAEVFGGPIEQMMEGFS